MPFYHRSSGFNELVRTVNSTLPNSSRILKRPSFPGHLLCALSARRLDATDLFVKWEVRDVDVACRGEDSAWFPMHESVVRHQHADLLELVDHVVRTETKATNLVEVET